MPEKRKNLVQQLAEKLTRSGVSPETATTLAKTLAPVARKAIKEEAEVKAPEVKVASTSHLSKAIQGGVIPLEGAIGADLLQKVMGRNSGPSYVVAAVKGEQGIIAVRKIKYDLFNVKFYPNLEFWGLGIPEQRYRKYPEYERGVFILDQFAALTNTLLQASQGKSRVKTLANRYQVAMVDAIEEVLSDPVYD